VEKLRRFSTFVVSCEREHRRFDRGRVKQSCRRRLGEQVSEETLSHPREISRRRNRRSGFIEETAKSRQSSDLRRVVQGLSLRRAEKEPGSHRDSAHRRIGIPETGVLYVEIAISDFPKRSEPLISRTRVRGSSGIGVRHFGVSEDRGTVTPGIAISRNAISRQSELWAPEGVIGDRCRRASGFGVL
jgi:hypothetical protein